MSTDSKTAFSPLALKKNNHSFSHITAGHVRFAEGTHLDPDKLHITGDGSQYHLPEAHIGFLRNHHTYHAGR